MTVGGSSSECRGRRLVGVPRRVVLRCCASLLFDALAAPLFAILTHVHTCVHTSYRSLGLLRNNVPNCEHTFIHICTGAIHATHHRMDSATCSETPWLKASCCILVLVVPSTHAYACAYAYTYMHSVVNYLFAGRLHLHAMPALEILVVCCHCLAVWIVLSVCWPLVSLTHVLCFRFDCPFAVWLACRLDLVDVCLVCGLRGSVATMLHSIDRTLLVRSLDS